jgi:hypothetical protein
VPTIYLALAFDHELSLGGSRNYLRDLFEPTERILAAASSAGVPVTLFSDVLCGVRFREWGAADFYEPYEAQLRRAVVDGHDVQLHLHPHWLDVTFDGAAFTPALSRYALSDFAAERYPRNIDGIVDTGIDYLAGTLETADPTYRCVAFRAGGFCLQKSTVEIVRALWRRGVRIDSSIPPGYRFVSQLSGVDYSRFPRSANWRIGLDGRLDRGADDGLFEVPIATIPRNPVNNALALAQRVLHRRRAYPSSGIPLYDIGAGLGERLRRLLPMSAWMLSFDYYYRDARYLLSLLSDYVKGRAADKTVFVSSVSHPKSMGPHNVELMTSFVAAARRAYGADLEFCTFRDIHRQVFESERAMRPAALARGTTRA